MNDSKLNMNELEMSNGGGILDVIGQTISWTYDKIIQPVGSFVVDNVKKVIVRPLKPLLDRPDEPVLIQFDQEDC